MAVKIKELVSGSEDTLLSATRANELIRVLNALAGMVVQPANAGSVEVGAAGGAVLKLNMDAFGGGGTPTTPNPTPFEISIENPTTLRIQPGILRCFYQGSSLLDIIPAPLDPITGGTIALNSWVYLHVVVAQYGSLIAVQSATVISNNTENQQSLYPNFYLKLGGVSGSAAFNYHTTSFQFSVCGFNHEFLTV